jgi:hypothetical protein
VRREHEAAREVLRERGHVQPPREPRQAPQALGFAGEEHAVAEASPRELTHADGIARERQAAGLEGGGDPRRRERGEGFDAAGPPGLDERSTARGAGVLDAVLRAVEARRIAGEHDVHLAVAPVARERAESRHVVGRGVVADRSPRTLDEDRRAAPAVAQVAGHGREQPAIGRTPEPERRAHAVLSRTTRGRPGPCDR